jgi:hypothetical protein
MFIVKSTANKSTITRVHHDKQNSVELILRSDGTGAWETTRKRKTLSSTSLRGIFTRKQIRERHQRILDAAESSKGEDHMPLEEMGRVIYIFDEIRKVVNRKKREAAS